MSETVTFDCPHTDKMDAHRWLARRLYREYPHALVAFVERVGPLADGNERWIGHYELDRTGR